MIYAHFICHQPCTSNPVQTFNDPRNTELHKTIRETYPSIFEGKASDGIFYPFHIKREFSKYLTCGVPLYGMARFQCSLCQKDKFVAYSCKGRTICPRCNGRRMADTAKHLVEEVIPDVPVRQWVLSMPYNHRFILSSDQKLLNKIIKIFHLVINSHYVKKGRQKQLINPSAGAITVIQRFGGALNLNIHFHSLYLDGVFHTNPLGEQTFFSLSPTDEEVASLTAILHHRINRAFIRAGYLTEDNDKELYENNSQLDLLKSQSVCNLVDNYQRPKTIGKYWHPPFVEFSGSKCYSLEGFSLHANTKIRKGDRGGLEKLCRYVCRGAIPKDRISQDKSAQVVLKLKSPYTDGTTHIKFTPEQFIKRIIALIPPPRVNLIRYYGVLGARHKKRSQVTSMARAKKIKKTDKKKKKIYHTPWAELMKHVFHYEVDICDNCGSKLKFIASITSPIECRKILKHINIDDTEVSADPPRGPPEEKFELNLDNFDQSHTW